MVLVNGAEGIGTGWSTKVPNYDVREVSLNLRRMLEGEEPSDMVRWSVINSNLYTSRLQGYAGVPL